MTCCQIQVYIQLLILDNTYVIQYLNNTLITCQDIFILFECCPGGAGASQRRQRLAQDFLTWMDQTGDFLSLGERQEIDPVKQERIEVRGRWPLAAMAVMHR